VFRTRLRQIAAAVVVVLVLAGGVAALRLPTTYETAVGERRVITLSDGSRLSLDSNTKVTVRYSRRARMLNLERGRSRFDVAHDVTRPFSVTAGAETVIAVGTSFDVERLDGEVVVTLLEGKVVVSPTKSDVAVPAENGPQRAKLHDQPVKLSAGQQLVASTTNAPAITPANLQAATAWESGRLEIYDEPLNEVVARVNRYASDPILLDPRIADLRVSGVFNAGDVNAFVDAVTTYFPVEAVADNGRISLRARH